MNLKCDRLLSTSAFKINLRRYNKGVEEMVVASAQVLAVLFAANQGAGQGLTLVPISAQLELFCPPYDPT